MAGVKMLIDGIFVNLDSTAIATSVIHDGLHRVHDLRSAAVIDGKIQDEAGVVGGLFDGPIHALLHLGGQFAPASDELHPNVVLLEGRHLDLQVAAQQLHEERCFGLRSAQPVFHGEGVEGEGGQSDARGALHGIADGEDPRAMPGNAREMAAFGPAAVAVHDDRNVPGEPCWIEPGIKLCFLVAKPGRDGRSHAYLAETIDATTAYNKMQRTGVPGKMNIYSALGMRRRSESV